MTEPAVEFLDWEATYRQLADQLQVPVRAVRSTATLLNDGNTIPFIARYRKEMTQSLDESALRTIEDGLAEARELAARKNTVVKAIQQQGKLTPDLFTQIQRCADKQTLEHLYLPYKPKRQTRASVARDRGLQPLADLLLQQQPQRRSQSALLQPYVNPDQNLPDTAAVLQGACDIVAEQWSEAPAVRDWLVEQAWQTGQVAAAVKRGKNDPASKFASYFDHRESVRRVPSHRWLAMRRGEAEGVLRLSLVLDDETLCHQLQHRWVHQPQFEFYSELQATVVDCYQRLLLPATTATLFQQLQDQAEAEAIAVFAQNLRELLLAAPAGPQVTMGIDPGFRTGCKIAVVDGTGKFLAHTTVYPTPPKLDSAGATQTIVELIQQFTVRLIAIGNGTAARETDAFVSQVLREHRLDVTKVMVSEAGASVYSASELAAREYPQLDVTVRGAISIAHRLQDPLAELVKIDPKAIGVGQYQHDVNQTALQKALVREVESCVNAVGVDVNLASGSLLAYVAGIGPKLAERLVQYRDTNGKFQSRQELLRVPKLGPKAFEQAAGFLRIRDGVEPLDNSAVHPESYPLVTRMAQRLGVQPAQLIGDAALVQHLTAAEFVDAAIGLPTINDILTELAKPGRDPRRQFQVVQFADAVRELTDLKPGMVLEGVITNVTDFGAFIDVGVHQDALIHISQLANHFVHSPAEVVKVGDIVKVKVLEVDVPRRRITVSRKAVSP